MLKTASILFLVFFFSLKAQTQTANMVVNVSNIKNIEGNLKLGIFDKVHNYRTKSNPYMKSKQEVTDSVASFRFENIPFGRYAVAVYHDENGDDTLNTKKLGIPIEGIGFSGKFNSRVKPPDFMLASFRLKSDTTISIKMIYNKKKKQE